MSTDPRDPAATTRRDVLRGAAAAAAAGAVGLPALLPAAARAADEAKPAAAKTAGDPAAAGDAKAAPAKRIRLGFIGIGKQASGHLGFFVGRTDTEVVAVCDVDKARREAAHKTVVDKYKEFQRKDFKGCDQYVDYREVLARMDVDAVVIGTPDHWHTTILVEAAKAGKHIYCEKPLTLTIAEAKMAVDAVRAHKVVFQTGSQQRSDGPFREVCDYIRNGKLGKITEVFVGIGVTSKPCDLPGEQPKGEIDWDRWLGQAPERPYNSRLAHAGELPKDYPFNPGWRDYREFSGGYVTDWGAHHFDITQWALSMDGSGPVEIHPPASKGDEFGAKFVYRGSPAGDEITVHHVKQVYERPDPKNPGKTVKETNGILFVGEKGKIFVSRSVKVSEPANILAEPLGEDAKKLANTGLHRVNWLDCIRSGGKPVCDVEVGAGSVTVCHLVNLAYWHGQKLKWDPTKWTFVDGAGDNAWLTRPQREKYALPAAVV
jgi:predicted dehydrogenase